MLRSAFLFIALIFVLPAVAAAELLDSIHRIRALPPEEAARNLPVAFEAMVTFHTPGSPGLTAYDGSEGIFVALAEKVGSELKPGARLRIEGVTEPGGFLPIVKAQRVSVLDVEPLPEPGRIDAGDLYSPSLDCQWVQVPAVITGIEEDAGIVLVAEVSGWTVKLVVSPDPHAQERIAQIMQRPVTIRGVVGSVFNEERQLTGRHFFVGSFDQIIPLENVSSDGEPRLRAVNELLRSDATSRTRVRVRGVVTHSTNHHFYLRGEGGSVLVRAAGASGLSSGARVEAEGFAAVAPFRPILRATNFTVLDRAAPPKPEPLDLSSKDIAGRQAELVTVDADFLAHRDGPDGEAVLQCRTGAWFFEALLPANSAAASGLGANDRVRLTGICEVTSTGALPFSGKVDGFRILLRDADDITVLQRAPWWTLRRLLWALGMVAAVALASLAWAALLRRRVMVQTQIIGDQIERAAVKDERQRIARELHDTIEQELAGVSVQLRNARQRLVHTPELAGASLTLAEKMLRHCREEARTSIRDLRSIALERRGLRGALEEFLAPLAAECGAQFSMDVQGEPRSLAGPAEVHLLRIAQEAVANAARHAAPGEIRVRLEFTASAVALEMRDNGCGFDPNAPAPRGHFGILGMRERANKLRAELTIQSAPGAGTAIRVVVPAETAARSRHHPI